VAVNEFFGGSGPSIVIILCGVVVMRKSLRFKNEQKAGGQSRRLTTLPAARIDLAR